MIDDTLENKNKEETAIALEAFNKEIPYFRRIKEARATENTDKSDRMEIITWFLHWHSSPKTRQR